VRAANDRFTAALIAILAEILDQDRLTTLEVVDGKPDPTSSRWTVARCGYASATAASGNPEPTLLPADEALASVQSELTLVNGQEVHRS